MLRKIKYYLSTINYKSLFFALLGSAIIAFGTYNIHANSNIPEGGIIGLSLIIDYYTGISPAISNLVINALCCILAWRLMGTRFMMNAAVASLGFSVFYAIFEAFPPVIPVMTNYPLLAALFGATFIEVGTGISLRYGSAPSGEHALSMALVKRGGLDFGWVHFLRDFVVIVLSLCYANAYSVVYALLIMTVTTPLTEYIVKAPRKQKVKETIVQTRNSWIPKVVLGLTVVIILTGVTVYLNDYRHADNASIRAFSADGVSEVTLDEGVIAYVPEGEVKAGFVFYPGGKVEYTAYAPLLKACAQNGIVCVIIEMPYNLAIFGINKGTNVPSKFPEIENWYIGGHGLGGNMAANCAANHDTFDGVILLGAYSSTDISDLRVLSVYGTNDGILNKNIYNNSKDNLPKDYKEEVISGGNHAYFGMYSAQKGDGTSTITNVEQINITADYIAEFILN